MQNLSKADHKKWSPGHNQTKSDKLKNDDKLITTTEHSVEKKIRIQKNLKTD